MNKIKLIANKDTNYIFHMLSVMKCGYNNSYGDKYRNLYSEEEQKIFLDNIELLTVCGGEHLGKLYGLMVCVPARAKISAKEYYLNLLNSIAENKLDKSYEDYIEIIKKVSLIMIKHYDEYIENIWNVERSKIDDYIIPLQKHFDESDFTDKAETLLGCKLKRDYFIATMVNSVENGPEAIDISDEQDVFGIERIILDAVYFIGHEFIIYLLLEALKTEDAFNNFDTWYLTESLAEYYLKQIMGDTRFFNEQLKYVEFYEKCTKDKTLTAVELYKLALVHYK